MVSNYKKYQFSSDLIKIICIRSQIHILSICNMYDNLSTHKNKGVKNPILIY